MNDVLPKPFTKEGLLNLLEKHLGHLKEQKPATQAKSPTGSWHSPNQLAGVSPTGAALTDESYVNTMRGHQPHSMDGYPHRRTASEMSGADETVNDTSKRQRVFVQPYGNTGIGPIQRVPAG
jgi:osomolarity two-component system response regulator SKN7